MSDSARHPAQGSAKAKQEALQRFHQWGARNLVKVTNPGEVRHEVQGYITFIQAIAGKTPQQISRILGLRETDLNSGAMIYRLDRLPHDHEFEVRGFSTLVDGKALPPGQTQNAAGYSAGGGALQYEIAPQASIPATLLGLLKPGEAFDLRTIRRPGASATVFSGKEWWRANEAKYPNSADFSALTPAFASAVGSFVRALEAGGATVVVAATRRHRLRAHLMYYSWRVAQRSTAPAAVPSEPGVEIIWDHGNAADSRRAAEQMVALFEIVHEPSLTSNHIFGKAVDMKISWTLPFLLRDARGRDVLIDKPRRDSVNSTIHAVGASYGVRKLLKDPPHWSVNGH